MIKQIIWDFDGVIIFSDQIREEGFRKVLKDFDPASVDQMLVFHKANGGLSRYVKFRYLLEEVMGKIPDEILVQQLADNFSAIMRIKMVDPKKLNRDALQFIRNTQGKITHHIASGSDGDELRYLCHQLGIHSLFKSIHGSPTSKKELVGQILDSNNYVKAETCLIGDAMNDYEAANVNEIVFFGYNNPDLSKSGIYLNSINEIQL